MEFLGKESIGDGFFSSNFPFGCNSSLRFFTQARLEMTWADKARNLYTRRTRLHLNSANCLRCCLLDLSSVGDNVLPFKQAKSMRLEFFTFPLLIGVGIPLILLIILWCRKRIFFRSAATPWALLPGYHPDDGTGSARPCYIVPARPGYQREQLL